MRFLCLLLLPALSLLAADSIQPGEVSTPFPTLTNLAVEWQVEGDDDLDASCGLRYRKTGEARWLEGMPLIRVPQGASQGTKPVFAWTNRLSGSVFDLEPGTEYELELSLHDPDGGEAVKTVKAATRSEPVAKKDAILIHGGKSDLNRVKPGEVLLLEDGDYGAVTFNRDGEPGRPIVYRSTGGGAVFKEVGLVGRRWVYLEGVTVNGPVRMNGSEHCVVRCCVIRSQYGIKAYKPGMMNTCIEDNVITGIREWRAEILGAEGDNDGEGILFTGSGNVIRHNRVMGFRDCISHMEDEGAVPQICNDVLNNDILAGLDDGIEGDFAMHNCRFMRNRLTHCFVGISSQPGLGGPNYFMRNVLFNIIHEAFKLHRFSRGDVILQNTSVKAGDALGVYTGEEFDHVRIEHNWFVGGRPPPGPGPGGHSPGRGRVVDLQRFGDHCIIDHNTYSVRGLPLEGKFLSQVFRKLPGERFEAHGREIPYDGPFPEDLMQMNEPPDLTGFRQAGAYDGDEPAPVYGPRK
jgi:hypothetical protein